MPQTALKYIKMPSNYLNCLRIPSNVYTFVAFLNLVFKSPGIEIMINIDDTLEINFLW